MNILIIQKIVQKLRNKTIIYKSSLNSLKFLKLSSDLKVQFQKDTKQTMKLSRNKMRNFRPQGSLKVHKLDNNCSRKMKIKI